MARTPNEVLPVLSEHEAFSKVMTTNPGSDYTPTEKEKKSIKLVERLFGKAKKARKNYDENWLKYYRMFRGRQWDEARPSFRHSEVINLVFRAIQSDVPILVDTRPQIEFLPQEPSDLPLSKILNEVVKSDWEKYGWLNVITEILYDAHIYGTGFGEVSFDPEKEAGLGAITFESVEPFYMYPDPEAKNVQVNCDYIIKAEPMSIDKIKSKWKKKGKYVKGDVVDFDKQDKTNFNQIRFKSPTDARTVIEGSSGMDTQKGNEAVVITLYIKDKSVKQTEVENDGGGTEFEQQLKYPHGRKVVVAGGVVLEDQELAYEDGAFPFARMQNYILPREFWGISEIEQLESPQKIFNKLVSFSLDVLTLMGNPVWIVDSSSGIDTDNIVNRPGLILEKNPGSEVRREEGVQLQPFVLQLVDRLKSYFDDISGSNDVSRGAQPTGITAAAAIEALQEAANIRLRQKGRNLDGLLQEIGQLYLSRVFQFYSAPRVVRLTNDKNANQFFSMVIEERPSEESPEETVKVAQITDLAVGDGFNVKRGETLEFPINGSFDVKVATGTSLPYAKAAKEQQALNLFDRGILDAEEVLKTLDYPNKEQILLRIKEQQQAMAQQQAQGQAPVAK